MGPPPVATNRRRCRAKISAGGLGGAMRLPLGVELGAVMRRHVVLLRTADRRRRAASAIAGRVPIFEDAWWSAGCLVTRRALNQF
jgi:hypothetical protein